MSQYNNNVSKGIVGYANLHNADVNDQTGYHIVSLRDKDNQRNTITLHLPNDSIRVFDGLKQCNMTLNRDMFKDEEMRYTASYHVIGSKYICTEFIIDISQLNAH